MKEYTVQRSVAECHELSVYILNCAFKIYLMLSFANSLFLFYVCVGVFVYM